MREVVLAQIHTFKVLKIEQTKIQLCQGKLSIKLDLFSGCTYVQQQKLIAQTEYSLVRLIIKFSGSNQFQAWFLTNFQED
jgi:hypothetical protein